MAEQDRSRLRRGGDAAGGSSGAGPAAGPAPPPRAYKDDDYDDFDPVPQRDGGSHRCCLVCCLLCCWRRSRR